jgi:hypothetical protein
LLFWRISIGARRRRENQNSEPGLLRVRLLGHGPPPDRFRRAVAVAELAKRVDHDKGTGERRLLLDRRWLLRPDADGDDPGGVPAELERQGAQYR